MSAPADIIRKLLLDLNLVQPNHLFVAFLPDAPDSAVCIYDTSPKRDGRLMEDGEQIEHPGIQIVVRDSAYPTGWGKAEQIALELDSVRNVDVAPATAELYTLVNVSRTSGVLPTGSEPDGKRRHYFSINAIITVNRSE